MMGSSDAFAPRSAVTCCGGISSNSTWRIAYLRTKKLGEVLVRIGKQKYVETRYVQTRAEWNRGGRVTLVDVHVNGDLFVRTSKLMY